MFIEIDIHTRYNPDFKSNNCHYKLDLLHVLNVKILEDTLIGDDTQGRRVYKRLQTRILNQYLSFQTWITPTLKTPK